VCLSQTGERRERRPHGAYLCPSRLNVRLTINSESFRELTGTTDLVASVSKLSVGVQTEDTYKGRLSLREGEGEGEGCSQRVVPLGGPGTPHLNPLPLAKGRGETNAMGLITGGH